MASIDGEREFNALHFVAELCDGKKVEVDAKPKFKAGWANIFRDFIQKVGNCEITIVTLSDERNFLEIDVELGKTRRAKQIYSEIQKAKYLSLRTCNHCGRGKSDLNNLLCKSCNEDAAQLKITGTWLDRY